MNDTEIAGITIFFASQKEKFLATLLNLHARKLLVTKLGG